MNYYNEIKTELVNNEVYKKAKDYSKNRIDLNAYYKVGKLLNDAGKHYGEGIINEYSKRLTIDVGKGYSKRNLWLMLRFYEFREKVQTLSAQLSWSHYCELLSIESIDEINYYIMLAEEYYLSIRELRTRIKNKEYERLSEETKTKLINNDKHKIEDFIKNPILIKNSYNYENISEKLLKQSLKIKQ